MSYQEGIQVGNAFMNMGRTFMMVDQMQGRRQDRALKLQDKASDEKAHELAGLLANQGAGKEQGGMQQVEGKMPGATGMPGAAVNMPDAPKIDRNRYTAKEWFDGHSLDQQQQQRDFEIKRDKYHLSEQGRKEQTSKIATRVILNNDNIKNYMTSVKSRAPIEEQAVAAVKVVNGMPNGITAKMIPGKDGALHKVEITNWAGESEIIDLTPENIANLQSQANALIHAHVKLNPNQQLELQGKHALVQRNKNAEKTTSSFTNKEKWYQSKKDGEIYYLIDEGLGNPDTGETQGKVFTLGINEPLISFDSDEAKALELRPYDEVTREATAQKAILKQRGERAKVETAEVKLSRLKAGTEKPLTLVQRQKQVDSEIDEQLANKLLNDPSIKDAIYNGTVTAANVLKNPSAHLSPDRYKLHQKTKALALKYSKDMPIQEAIQKAETETQISTGDDLVSKFVAIKDPEERKAFAQNLKESDPELFAIFQEASKRYDAKAEKKVMKDKNYPSDWKGGLINRRQS